MEAKHTPTTEHVSDSVEEPATQGPAIIGVNAALKRFQERQHSLTYKEAASESWKPLVWCAYMFFICIMYGYDALVGSVVISIEQFREDFGLPFFPESTYWLVSHGKEEKARHEVIKLHREDFDVDGRMAEIHAALHQQKEEAANQGTITDCFKKGNRKRTMIAMMMFFIQNATGTGWVIGYMSYFMQLADMSASRSFDATVGISGVMLVGNMFGWFSVEWLGRRGTALYGSIMLFTTLLIIGILAVISGGNNVLVAQVVFMGVWAFIYQGTLGAVAWPISAENATSWLRTPTQALCTICNALSASIWGLSLPYAVNPDQGNLQGKIAFIYAALMALAVFFVYFFVPETKGRSYMEIDELWNRGAPPRKFASQTIVPVEVTKEDN